MRKLTRVQQSNTEGLRCGSGLMDSLHPNSDLPSPSASLTTFSHSPWLRMGLPNKHLPVQTDFSPTKAGRWQRGQSFHLRLWMAPMTSEEAWTLTST